MSDNKKNLTVKKYLPLIISPLTVAAAVLFVFLRRGFYPFGDRTAAWCDMNQQVVPLLCQLKDILERRSGWLLSFKNASGMNFIGVFFFFLSSPFSFLVRFVDKEDMLLFANILVLMKMMTCSVTASLYFVRSDEHKGLSTLSVSLLGFIYAASGYVMLFYQNVIWLDIMYLFPLLLISLERLHRTGSPLMYIAAAAGIMIVNYYIGYMVVLFLLLIAGVYSVCGVRADSDASANTTVSFLVGSCIAALMSAAVWLPSFVQYMHSGRRTSIIESLRTGTLVTDYDTVLPVLFGSSALIVLAFTDVRGQREKRITAEHRVYGIMAVLLLIPVFFEPINKVWHTGSYMAFPARYAFMTVFMLLILAAYSLGGEYGSEADAKRGRLEAIAFTGAGAAAVALYAAVSIRYIGEDIDALSEYTRSLGGSESSFKGLLKLLAVGIICVSIICLLRKKGRISKNAFVIFLSAVTMIEAAGNTRIYMTYSGEHNEDTYALQRQLFGLSDRIDDDGFYRVKTSGKIFDYNMIGAMGYNSIGHYTSLTDEDYMFTMKRLGYTSVWMEQGTCGGTELTDAMLSVGYEIGSNKPEDTVCSVGSYNLYPLGCRLDLGVVTDSLPEQADIPEALDRAEVQQYIFDSLFGSGEKLIFRYAPDEGSVSYSSGKAFIEQGELLIYRIKIGSRQTLYFDCFDRLSNELSEPIYGSFSVRVNGRPISRGYPYSKENGVLRLGSFEDETVVVEISAQKDAEAASFGVFGLDAALVGEKCSIAETVGFREIPNGLSGSADLDEPSEVLVAVPYDRGFTLTINGERQPIRRTLSCFMSFALPKGHSDIEIRFVPTGLRLGVLLSLIGAAGYIAAAVGSVVRRRRDQSERSLFAAYVVRYLFAGLGLIVFALVYLMPLILNTVFWEKT